MHSSCAGPRARLVVASLIAVAVAACTGPQQSTPDAMDDDARPAVDGGRPDAVMTDAATTDAPTTDAPTIDAPMPDAPMVDAAAPDAAPPDAAAPDAAIPDAAPPDAAMVDAAIPDAAPPDAAPPDAAPPDAAPPDAPCGDRDGDGADDCSDGCPDDPGKTAPGLCGCGNLDDPSFSAPRDEVMFVTTVRTPGDLRAGQPTGHEGADAACQAAADAAGLGRDFEAVVGGSGIGALADRVRLCGRVTTVGGTVLFDDLRDMTSAGVGVPRSTAITDASGAPAATAPAWTGLAADGTASLSNCGQFQSSTSAWAATTGAFTSPVPGGWLGGGAQSCASTARLYCISQLPPDELGLAITPATLTVGLAVTDTAHLSAMARFTYGGREDVSAAATWDSSDPLLASVTGGTVVFTGPGTVTITARQGGFTATATLTATDEVHRIFITSAAWPLGSGDNVEFQNANNATCQAAATAAGLTGTWLGVYATGFIRKTNGAPLTIGGPVLDLDGNVVGFPDLSAGAPIGTDETGAALPGGATTWTSECAYDFLAHADVAFYGTPSTLEAMKVACTGDRRRVCISQ